VQRQSKRLATLINDLLDISRIEAGRAEFKHHSISMIDIIKDRIGDLRLQADEKSIRLHLIGATELPSVCGDEERIGQVLTNLIGNAIKFTPDKGIVSIRVNIPDQVGNVSDNNTVHIEVIDTGAGVPVEERQKVFDKFYQKSNIHTRQEGGTGLGLAIAKGIIEAHGGNLWIGDGENGVGSNFQFTLPI
jgi:signal transduction histidine kinase